MDRIQTMFEALAGARPEVLPSKFWEDLNRRNLAQLKTNGYENFKQTLATNYFTWLPLLRSDPQFRFLVRHLPPIELLSALWQGITAPRHQLFSQSQSLSYNLLTHLLWSYACRQSDMAEILTQLDEPLEGNPPKVYRSRKLISQDIANSALEYQSITQHTSHEKLESIMELGAGYGRTAYVFLKLMPHVKYIIVDIPPALYVSEKYLSSQFNDRNIFHFRPFTDYTDVKAEMDKADLIFLLPNQLELLPNNLVSLFVNISSLHEMRLEQIRYYFEQIDRIAKRYVYIKQWKISYLPTDDTVIQESDYPIPAGWKEIYWRECAVQTYFFEAMFQR